MRPLITQKMIDKAKKKLKKLQKRQRRQDAQGGDKCRILRFTK